MEKATLRQWKLLAVRSSYMGILDQLWVLHASFPVLLRSSREFSMRLREAFFLIPSLQRHDLRGGVTTFGLDVGTVGGNHLAPDLRPLNECSLNTVGSKRRRFLPISLWYFPASFVNANNSFFRTFRSLCTEGPLLF